MQSIKQSLFTIIICLILLAGVNYVMAWTAPSASPPDSNVSAPLNVGSTAQTKAGSLISSSDIRAPILYDQDNTGYYTDPASNSWLYRLYSYDIRADILYDRNNTGYYLDPAGTSRLNAITPDSINLGGVSRSSWPVEGGNDQIIWFGNIGALLKNGAYAGGNDDSYVTGSTCTAYPASAAKIENGKVYTRVYFPGSSGCNVYCGCCNTGWVEGTSASCSCNYGSIRCAHSATTNKDGVNGHLWQ